MSEHVLGATLYLAPFCAPIPGDATLHAVGEALLVRAGGRHLSCLCVGRRCANGHRNKKRRADKHDREC